MNGGGVWLPGRAQARTVHPRPRVSTSCSPPPRLDDRLVGRRVQRVRALCRRTTQHGGSSHVGLQEPPLRPESTTRPGLRYRYKPGLTLGRAAASMKRYGKIGGRVLDRVEPSRHSIAMRRRGSSSPVRSRDNGRSRSRRQAPTRRLMPTGSVQRIGGCCQPGADSRP